MSDDRHLVGPPRRMEDLQGNAERMSEDLRANLATVKGSIDTLLKHWERLDEGERRAFVMLASSCLDNLTSTFMALTRDSEPL